MPTLYMLIGPPGVGKSTWLESQGVPNANCLDLSTDYYIDQYAEQHGITYNEAFQHAIKDAEKKMYDDLEFAKINSLDIYWDQTNTGRKARMSKMRRAPGYRYVAVFFETPHEEEHARRLNRPGKTIPDFVMKNMMNPSKPTADEGFDELIYLAWNGTEHVKTDMTLDDMK